MVDFLHQIGSSYPNYVLKELNSFACGYFDNQLHVCCPLELINIIAHSPQLEPPDVSTHRNLKLLPEECRDSDKQDVIKFGYNAPLDEFPWMALLYYGTGKIFVYSV